MGLLIRSSSSVLLREFRVFEILGRTLLDVLVVCLEDVFFLKPGAAASRWFVCFRGRGFDEAGEGG